MLTVILLAAALASAQDGRPGVTVNGWPPAKRAQPPRGGPLPPEESLAGPEARRIARDKALARVGPSALGFTKRYGDLAVRVLLACDPQTGRQLVELHESGDLEKLADAKLALEACRRYGEVARWLVEHHELLRDGENLRVWAERPVDFAYDLADLSQQAEERKKALGLLGKLGQEPWQRVGLVAALALGGFLLARARSRKAPGGAA